MEDDSPRLLEIISREIELYGPIPFSRYMELCLYHPVHGFYCRTVPITGREGDYYTAPHVHGLFGRTVARWFINRSSDMKLENVTILELGPGNGRLAEDILNEWEKESKGRPLSFILVEESPQHRMLLEERFVGRPVTVLSPDVWDEHGAMPDFVIANEFFDALPLRIAVRRNDELREIFVDLDGGIPAEKLVSLGQTDTAVKEALDQLPEGRRMEFSDGWRCWLDRLSRGLDRGAILIIDYGDDTESLIAPWRRSGTLRCYRKHRVDGDPFDGPGSKDITAHVNFSVMRKLAENAGLTVESCVTQSSFLIRAGILDLLAADLGGTADDSDYPEQWLTVKNLIHDEGGMGEVFKAMVLVKDREPGGEPDTDSRQVG